MNPSTPSADALKAQPPVELDARPHLLLVEDDALIAMSEQMELERYGYQVALAGTGEEAIEISTAGQQSISSSWTST